MKEIKLKKLWTLDIEINNQMIQVYSSKYKVECKTAQVFYPFIITTIQKRKVLTDKY